MEPIRLQSIFQESEQSEILEYLVGALIAGHMLYPKDLNGRENFVALSYHNANHMLVNSGAKNANELFYQMICSHFSNFAQYADLLISTSFKASGKGSLSEKSWKGYITGRVLFHAITKNISLNKASTIVKAELKKNLFGREEFADITKPDSDNIMKNYWSEYKDVAHFWAAMNSFILPDKSDLTFRLDKAIYTGDIEEVSNGWYGIAFLAEAYLHEASNIKIPKSSTTLLNKDTALRIIFENPEPNNEK